MRARIPRYLHLPPQVLWFDMEDIGLIGGFYFFWLMVDHWMVAVAGIFIVWTFMNTKGRMPRGYLKHLAYRLGFWTSKSYPPTAVRVHRE